ncbi:MAG TPA: hypothetical protein VK633_07795, partial [Verrucomicrobiae bacterium]|nr:hypothetical protein [Verrucomicrobiae bacterium]
ASPNAAPALSPRTAELFDTMKSSLEEERGSREQLAAMLSQTEEALRLQRQLAAEREEQLRRASTELQTKEEKARQIEQAGKAIAADFVRAQGKLNTIQRQLESTSLEARLSQQRLSTVEQQFAKAQTNLVHLEKELSTTGTEARLARERLAQIEADLRSRQSEAEQARQRIEKVEELRLSAEIERERIAGKLKVAETQKEMTQQQLADAKGQIASVQQEKAQIQKVASELAEGVVQFAEKQGELTKEIRENRPQTANMIFSEFLTNRVNTDFRANRSGILGRTISKDSQTRTILVTDGTQTFAIYHIEDTPFRLDEFGKDWERFFVHLYRANTILPVPQINFLSLDPRVIVAPVSPEQAKQLGVKVYKLTSDPLRFQDALLVGADEGYYGECKFMLDARNRGYLKMDRSVLGKLMGKFNPSRGDLVFSKGGDLIGMMVNKQYCALLTGFVPTATIPTGSNLNAESVGMRLNAMQKALHELPGEMQ